MKKVSASQTNTPKKLLFFYPPFQESSKQLLQNTRSVPRVFVKSRKNNYKIVTILHNFVPR
jgi:hypothetical protein